MLYIHDNNLPTRESNNKWFLNKTIKIASDGTIRINECEYKFFDRGWTRSKHKGYFGDKMPKNKRTKSFYYKNNIKEDIDPSWVIENP